TTAPALCLPTTSGTTTANCNTGPGRGTVADDAAGTITWTPRSDIGAGSGTLGRIGVNETERMRFTYTQNNTSTVTSLQFPTTAFWSDASNFAGEVAQSSLTCSVTVTTPVTFAGFKARRDGDDLVLGWSTSTEAGNAGFHVYAQTAKGTRRLTDQLIPSQRIDSLEPLHYTLRVPAAGLGKAKFFVEEVSTRGTAHRNGPFTARDSFDGIGEMQKTDWAEIRAEHESAESGRDRQERGGAAKAGIAAAAQGGPSATPPVDLLVNKSGLYRVTYEQLAGAGFDLSKVKGEDLSLTSGGATVPLYVGGGRFFGPGSYVEFYGKALDTLYTDTNVYRLAYDKRAPQATVDNAAPNASTPAVASYLETTRVERDNAYSFSAPNGDPWYDSFMGVFGSPASTQFTINLDNVVPGGATLDVGLWGFTDWPQGSDHHVVLSFNGSTVADDVFDGVTDHPVHAGLAAGVVHAGVNTLTVSQPADAGVAYDFLALDHYSVTYPRAFVARDNRLTFTASGGRFVVNGLTSPNVVVYRDTGALARLAGVQVTGAAGSYSASFPGGTGAATYYVSAAEAMLAAGMRAARDGSAITTGQAQYLVISHPDFIGGLGQLVNARQAQGLTVKTVDVRDVYARFSSGVFDARAIKDYVAYAAANMGTKYVLLVGGDTYDYRNFGGSGSLSFIPSLYAVTGPYVAFAPVDSLAADVSGDGVQDIAIGRFPVRTVAELDQMIGRTLDYQHKSYSRSAVFAADAFDADSATSFTVLSDRLVGAVPSWWSVSKAYLDLDNLAVAKGKLVDAIDGGVALTHFIGHSGPTNWTYHGLFDSSDAAALGNGGKPTIIAQLGCWNAYYVSPTYDTLAHRFLLSGDRGAAAVLGPTTLTETDSERELGEALTPLLVRPGTTIGDAVVQAKRITAIRRANAVDVLLGFTILGDPALAVDP
ncbi:MAG TPA: C25 family cysteine peptidase, partial [Thermoanaerobaculia bacterium]|nr:C25 family cysteine peptidase [Thermoanaerobaculia bacterium]